MIKVYVNYEYYCSCENQEQLDKILQKLEQGDLSNYGIIEIEYVKVENE